MAIYYLLSGGARLKSIITEEMLPTISRDLKGKKRLVSFGAERETEKNDIYFYGDENCLGTVNSFSFSDLDTFDLIDIRTSKEKGIELIKNADIIYLQGGDPFVQLKYLKDNGYDEDLKKFNGIILGISAGSMNMGRKAFYSKDEDYTETTIYDGLELVDITIDPHFDINDESRVNEALIYSKQIPIIGLPDNSMIRIDKGDITYIGPYYSFVNGKMTKKP